MMVRGNFPLRLPDSIRRAAEAAAAKDGVSLNQFINLAVAEKTAALTGAEMIAQRAARADKAAFDEILARVGSEPPRPGDEI